MRSSTSFYGLGVDPKVRRSLLIVIAITVILVVPAGFNSVTAKKPPRTALDVTITSPLDGIEVVKGNTFTVEGSVLAKRGDAGPVETFVQYSVGEGSTDFVNVDGTDLQIISGDQPQTETLQKDASYAVNWTLSGNLGTYEVRIFSQGSTVKSGASESRTVTISPETIPSTELVDVEYRDSSIGYGSATGIYSDTFYSDNVYEVLTEGVNKHGTNTPSDDTSELGWIYEFDGLTPRFDTDLQIECYAEFPRRDSYYEGFAVQVQYQGMWYDVVRISVGGSENMYSANLPDDSCQIIRVRIVDLDRTVGDRIKSSFYVDQLYLDTSDDPVVNPGKEILLGGSVDNHSVSTWELGPNTWYYDRSFPVSHYGWGDVNEILVIDVDGDGEDETIVGSHSNYVQIFECINGAMVPIHTMMHPGSGFEVIRSIAAADLDGDENPNLEILISSSNKDIQSAVFKMVDGVYIPIFNISSNDPRSVGGCACAIGDVDGDQDLEFIVTEEYPDTNGVSLLRLFDYDPQGETWVEIADYSFELGNGMLNWIPNVQILNLDDDEANEIFVRQKNSPLQVLEFSNGQLVKAWEANFGATGATTGDITNDGRVDIVTANSLGPDSEICLFMVYEFDGVTLMNTFNFSGPAFHTCGDNSMKIGDIDDDGQNELIFVYMINVDSPAQRSFFAVFRNDVLIFNADTGYRSSHVVAFGDYDNDATHSGSTGLIME
ncbi:MAG: hypothetical protein ACFFB7_02175 [Candidatus Sifarchaeia archaeon]